MQIACPLNSESIHLSRGSITSYLYFHAFAGKAYAKLGKCIYHRGQSSAMLTHTGCIFAWKWPSLHPTLVSNLFSPNCVLFPNCGLRLRVGPQHNPLQNSAVPVIPLGFGKSASCQSSTKLNAFSHHLPAKRD